LKKKQFFSKLKPSTYKWEISSSCTACPSGMIKIREKAIEKNDFYEIEEKCSEFLQNWDRINHVKHLRDRRKVQFHISNSI
jgi:hypothetical protein